MAGSPVPFKLIEQDQGHYRLDGELTFATAVDALRKTLDLFRGAPRLWFDLAGISRVDSAGVALLLEWMRQAAQTGTELHFVHLPPHIRAIARVSGIEHLLTQPTTVGWVSSG